MDANFSYQKGLNMEQECIDDASAGETVGIRLRTPPKVARLCKICRFIIKDIDDAGACLYCSDAICTDCVSGSNEGSFCSLRCVRQFISSRLKDATHEESKKYV